MEWNRDGARHLLMRLGLGFVMAWFGVQELRGPSEWAVFVPRFIVDISPIGVNDLILIHGFLLVLAAVSVVVGLFYLPGTLLAMGLVADIVFGLWVNDGFNDLVIRDIGLFGLAAALAADPLRFWHLDNVFSGVRPVSRSSRRRAEKGGSAVATGARVWPAQAGAAGVLIAVVAALGLLLNATGSSATVPGDSSVSSAASGSSASQPTPVATVAATQATPAPASSTLFDTWRYKQYSYEVYPGQVSDEGKKALAGFDLSVQDQGDQVVIYLNALSSRYKDSQHTVAKGDTAYFVETSMRDDPANQEKDLDDDGIVVVNQQGYILRS